MSSAYSPLFPLFPHRNEYLVVVEVHAESKTYANRRRSTQGISPAAITIFCRLTPQWVMASCVSPAMNGSGQHRRPNQRPFDGRIEKRTPTLLPVYLASLEDPHARERTLTENVSPHGVRIMSKRSWRPGEGSLITPLTGGTAVGRVIYCLPKTGDRFCLGVEFPTRTVKWDVHSSA